MKETINEQIAELLGFEKIIGKPGSGHTGMVMWEYPESWRDEVTSMPQTSLPDFMQMINDTRETAKRYKYGIPREYSNHK